MNPGESAATPNLRPATGPDCCGGCFFYKSLEDYKALVRQFGPGSPLVLAYGYGPEYLSKDGICEVSGDPPVLKSEVCDRFMAA